jgi:hypothetical protein
MANLDTRSKRASSVQILLTFISATVLPDGAISTADRAHILGLYSGILANSIAPNGIASTTAFGTPTLTHTIAPTGIATASAVGLPVLYEEASLTTIQSAWNNYTKPLFRFVINGTLIIDEDRLLSYEEKQTGRLGRAEATITLDNHDNYLNGLPELTPRHELIVMIGARVGATAYRARRHTLTILDITPVNFADETAAVEIRCENNWLKFRKPSAANGAWTDETIGDILDDIAGYSGVTIQRDASTCWAYTLDTWQLPAGLPPQPILADLIGDGQRTHAIACARFDAEGIWQVEGIASAPATDVALSVSANQYDSDIGTYGDIGTRFQVTGNATQETASADDLETLLHEQRIHIVNAYALTSTYVHARLVQEAVEQRERYQRGTLNMRPNCQIQLWHVVTLTDVANISAATQWRITSIYFHYAPSTFSMTIGLRAVATSESVTIITPLPVVTPPPVTQPPEIVNPPPPVLPKDTSVVDNLDDYDAADWEFTSGTWSVQTDLSTTDLDIAHALAQTSTTAARTAAVRQGNYSAANWFSAGIYLTEAGCAGLLAFAVDYRNGYEIKIDSAANTVTLIRWIDGNPYTLATDSQTIDITTGYFIALHRHGKYLRAYCSSHDNYRLCRIFSAANLAANEIDTTFLEGRIGCVSYGARVRFFTLRAGVPPAHTHGEHSDTTKPHGHRHCSGSAWNAPTGNAERSAWDTETCTHTDLARRIKALIDDLKNDYLLHD